MTDAEQLADLRQQLAKLVRYLRERAAMTEDVADVTVQTAKYSLLFIADHIERLLSREIDNPGRLIEVSLTEHGFEPVFAFGERGE